MKKTHRLLAMLLCLIVALTAVGCGGSDTPAATTTDTPAAEDAAESTQEANPNARVLKWSANSPEGYPDYESAMRIKAYVEEKTNGEIILEVYPDNILGDWTVVFDEIMAGGIDFTATSVPDYYDPRIAACTLPYLTATYDEVAAVFRKGGYYDQVLEECYEALNVKYFGVYCDGYCGVGVQGELENANVPGADKGDAIIRVPPNQSMILAVQNLGFNYSSIPYSDTYTSLQTGVVQGWCGGPISQHYGQWLDTETLDRLSQHGQGESGGLPLGETSDGFGENAVRHLGFAEVIEREGGGFQDDPAGAGVNFSVFAAHGAGEGNGDVVRGD